MDCSDTMASIPQTDNERHARADAEARESRGVDGRGMIDRIARIISPAAWNRDEFRSIVERTNGGHTIGIDIEASMEEARNDARQTARDVLEEVREPSNQAAFQGAEKLREMEKSDVTYLKAEACVRIYQAMTDAALAGQPLTPMDIAGESIAQLGLNNGVDT